MLSNFPNPVNLSDLHDSHSEYIRSIIAMDIL